jgi:hypothetical protein
MKNIKLFFTLLSTGILFSCERNVSAISYEGGTPAVISATPSTVSLEPGNEANTALVINWTNPDYKFSTGPNSHDVTYTLEMDTLGANFASSKKVSTVISKELSKSYTVGQLNAILGNDMLLQLSPRRNYTLQLRVTSSIGTAVKLTSNIISFTTKPFAPPPKVALPASGKLFITGSATPGGWMGAPAAELTSQKFTQMSSTLYVIPSIALTGGGSYKFVPVYGDWGISYGCVGAGNTNNVNGDNFTQGGNDMRAPATSGNYKIEVDFQIGKFIVTKL